MAKPRTATVRAAEPYTQCVEITHEAFSKLADSEPHLATMLSAAVISKLMVNGDRLYKEINLLLDGTVDPKIAEKAARAKRAAQAAANKEDRAEAAAEAAAAAAAAAEGAVDGTASARSDGSETPKA
eukprot:COSAG05_NODE_281_length_12267_cov_3.873028_5_plen_127_part_00